MPSSTVGYPGVELVPRASQGRAENAGLQPARCGYLVEPLELLEQELE